LIKIIIFLDFNNFYISILKLLKNTKKYQFNIFFQGKYILKKIPKNKSHHNNESILNGVISAP